MAMQDKLHKCARIDRCYACASASASNAVFLKGSVLDLSSKWIFWPSGVSKLHSSVSNYIIISLDNSYSIIVDH